MIEEYRQWGRGERAGMEGAVRVSRPRDTLGQLDLLLWRVLVLQACHRRGHPVPQNTLRKVCGCAEKLGTFQEGATDWGNDGGFRRGLLHPSRSSHAAVPSGLAYFLLEVRGGSGRFSRP